jgi:hypothetical protein
MKWFRLDGKVKVKVRLSEGDFLNHRGRFEMIHGSGTEDTFFPISYHACPK